MAELIAVVHPSRQGIEEARRTLASVRDSGEITLLDESFAQQLCQAMGCQGALFLAIAESPDRIIEAMRPHGCRVLNLHLGPESGLFQQAVGESDNPQVQGQPRRESGGESTEESGQ